MNKSNLQLLAASLAAFALLVGTCGLMSKCDDDAYDAAVAAEQERQADRTQSLAGLARLKADDPAAIWVSKCRVVEAKGVSIPDASKSPCAQAFGTEGRVALKASRFVEAEALLTKAKALGATVDDVLAIATTKATAKRDADAKAAAAVAAVEAKNAAREAAKTAGAGPKPMTFPNTGACVECEVYLDRVLHDPDSFDHDAVTEPKVVKRGKFGNVWEVRMTYRAKNAFGALTRQATTFWIQRGAVVDVSK